MKLGERLAEQRKIHNFTQAELSKKLNLSQQVISNYERNITSPPIEFIHAVADLYSISIDELLGRQLYKTNDNFEKRILDIVVTFNDEKKELSLELIKTLSRYRGKYSDK